MIGYECHGSDNFIRRIKVPSGTVVITLICRSSFNWFTSDGFKLTLSFHQTKITYNSYIDTELFDV